MVLLVDDDEDLLEMLDVLFTKSDIPHLVARSLSTVKKLDDVDKITLAILDVNLGFREPSGVAVARWLREKLGDIPIYFITGHAPEHPLVVEASEQGEGEVLAKPFDTRRLVEIAKGTK